MSFGKEVSVALKKMRDGGEDFVRAVNIELFSSVVRDSPVGNPDLWKWPAPKEYVGGRFRGNWQTTQDIPATGQLDRLQKGVGGPAIEEINQICARGYGLFWLSNNLPYGPRLEYDGWSGQAPDGMVRKNANRIKSILRKHAK